MDDGKKAVCQGPGFDVGVVDDDGEGEHDPEDPDIFRYRVPPQPLKDAGRGSLAVPAAIAADAPFDPHQRDSEK